MNLRNQPLAFLKPHAAGSAVVEKFVRDVFHRRRIAIMAEGILTGPEIARGGLVDRHYSVIARVGSAKQASDLFLAPAGRTEFKNAFGVEWDAALAGNTVVSGMEALRLHRLSAKELFSRWGRVKTIRVGSGFYVGRLDDLGVFVMNGFYPSLREIYTADDARVVYFVLDVDPAALSWKKFRSSVIGATNPERAEAGSLRGRLLRQTREHGLTLDSRDNAIHASASPFEALVEKTIWVRHFDPTLDPLHEALAGTLSLEDVLRLAAENPIVTLDGKSGPLIERLEDRDTADVAAALKAVKVPACP